MRTATKCRAAAIEQMIRVGAQTIQSGGVGSMNRRAFIKSGLFGSALLHLPVNLRGAGRGSVVDDSGGFVRRTGRVRLDDHALIDDQGPFLGLGASYFSALWRYRHDRSRFESDLSFLAQQGWFEAWKGLEIAPVNFTTRAGNTVATWPDYWQALAGLVDLSYDRFGIRTQITIFADAQLMPAKGDRLEHLWRMLTEVVAGREEKIILLEVANEAWQNGFPGEAGVADLREFTRWLADRTEVLVATTSNHEGSFESVYRDSAADIATWHFSRDRAADGGWRPVIDCRRLAHVPGCPPVSSNEPIGPGSSVSSESDPAKLVLAAAYGFASGLPMHVFHSEAGVFGRTRFEDTPAIRDFRHLMRLLPGDLPNWTSTEAGEPDAPLCAEGCVSMVCCRKDVRVVCVPVGIRSESFAVSSRMPLQLRAVDILTGRELGVFDLAPGKRTPIALKSAAFILMN